MLRTLLLCFFVSTVYGFYDQSTDSQYQTKPVAYFDTNKHDVDNSKYYPAHGLYRDVEPKHDTIYPHGEYDQQVVPQHFDESSDFQQHAYISKPTYHGVYKHDFSEETQKPEHRYAPAYQGVYVHDSDEEIQKPEHRYAPAYQGVYVHDSDKETQRPEHRYAPAYQGVYVHDSDEDIQKPEHRYVPTLKMSVGKDTFGDYKKTKEDKKGKKFGKYSDSSSLEYSGYDGDSYYKFEKKDKKFDTPKSKSKYAKTEKTGKYDEAVHDKEVASNDFDYHKYFADKYGAYSKPMVGKYDFEHTTVPQDYNFGKFNFDTKKPVHYADFQSGNTYESSKGKYFEYPKGQKIGEYYGVKPTKSEGQQYFGNYNPQYEEYPQKYTYDNKQYPGYNYEKYPTFKSKYAEYPQYQDYNFEQINYDKKPSKYADNQYYGVSKPVYNYEQQFVSRKPTFEDYTQNQGYNYDKYNFGKQYPSKYEDDSQFYYQAPKYGKYVSPAYTGNWKIVEPETLSPKYWSTYGTHVAKPYETDNVYGKRFTDNEYQYQPFGQQTYGDDIQHNFGFHPKLNMAFSSSKTKDSKPVTSVPGLYWKTFGYKIKESFNKTKPTYTETDTEDAVPVTYWINYGKDLSKAITDAKFKIHDATFKAKYPTVQSETEFPTEAPVMDTTFWNEFGKNLDNALTPKYTTTDSVPETTTESGTLNFADVQTLPKFYNQLDHTYDQENYGLNPTYDHMDVHSNDDVIHGSGMYHPKLRMAAGDEFAKVPLYQNFPGVYWKNYGDKIREAFMPLSVAEKATIKANPLFWINYGKQIGKTFTDAKIKLFTGIDQNQPLDDAFWAEFGLKLHKILQDTPVNQQVESVGQDYQYPSFENTHSLNYEPSKV